MTFEDFNLLGQVFHQLEGELGHRARSSFLNCLNHSQQASVYETGQYILGLIELRGFLILHPLLWVVIDRLRCRLGHNRSFHCQFLNLSLFARLVFFDQEAIWLDQLKSESPTWPHIVRLA